MENPPKDNSAEKAEVNTPPSANEATETTQALVVITQVGEKDKTIPESGEADQPETLEVIPEVIEYEHHTIEQIAKEFANQDSEHFRKIGFFLALDPEKDPMHTTLLVDKIQDRSQKGDEIKKTITGLVKNSIDVAQFEIELTKEKKDHVTGTLAKHLEECLQLEEELKHIQEEIALIQLQITGINLAMSKARESLVQDRIDELKIELVKLADTYDTVHAIKAKTFAQSNLVFQPMLDARILRLKETIVAVQKNLDELAERLRPANTLSDLGGKLLFHLGTAGIFVTGWLFSIYACREGFDADDWLEFSLKGIHALVNPSGGTAISIFFPVIIWCGFMFAILGVAWVADRLGKQRKEAQKPKNDKNKDDAAYEVEVAVDGENRYLARISSGTFLKFWGQAMPLLLVVGSLLALIIGASKYDNVEALTASLSGQMAGSFLATIAAGIAFLYIQFVLEERRTRNLPGRIFLQNIELTLFFVGTIIFVPCSFFFPDTSTIAVVAFGFALLLAGMVMGYAVYFRSLRFREYELKFELAILGKELDWAMAPKSMYAMYKDDIDFRNHISVIQEQIYELSEYKTRQSQQLLLVQHEDIKREAAGKNLWFRNVLALVKDVFASESDESDNPTDLPVISELEANYFRKFSMALDEFKRKSERLEKRESELKEAIRPYKERSTAFAIRLLKELDALDRRTKALVVRQAALKRSEVNCIIIIDIAVERQQTELRDGYDLGLWQRTNPSEFKATFYHAIV